MPDLYSVEQHRYGMILRGTPPLDDAAALMKLWGKRHLDTLALGLSSPLGACFVVTRWADMPAWIAEIEAAAKATYPNDPEGAWLHGPYVGTSSLTLFEALSEKWSNAARHRLNGDSAVPRDLDDFCRCRRVVEDVRPEWRGRLGGLFMVRPEWMPVINRWDELSAIAQAADALPRRSKKVWQEGWRELARRYEEATHA